jgi:hypothetical protein
MAREMLIQEAAIAQTCPFAVSVPVPEQLEIEIRRAGAMEQGCCPLCGSVFLIPRVTAVLQEGSLPLGYLCERCLMLGPAVAATNVSGRAELLRGLIERARQNVPVVQWLCVTVAVRERIERYEHLAARLRELAWWPMRVNR